MTLLHISVWKFSSTHSICITWFCSKWAMSFLYEVITIYRECKTHDVTQSCFSWIPTCVQIHSFWMAAIQRCSHCHKKSLSFLFFPPPSTAFHLAPQFGALCWHLNCCAVSVNVPLQSGSIVHLLHASINYLAGFQTATIRPTPFSLSWRHFFFLLSCSLNLKGHCNWKCMLILLYGNVTLLVSFQRSQKCWNNHFFHRITALLFLLFSGAQNFRRA